MPVTLTLSDAQAREITVRYLRAEHAHLMELFDDVYPLKVDAETAAEIVSSADKLLKVIEYLGSIASDRVLSENELRALVETSYE